MCSNQLSYRPQGPPRSPALHTRHGLVKDPELVALGPSKPESKTHLEAAKNFDRRCSASLDLVASKDRFRPPKLLRKEVIQPQVPLRLPCYDFTPVTNPTFNEGSLTVSLVVFWLSQLPWCDGRCVQGPGTYSPRRADPRLLAIPTSWSRVADSNPN